MKFVSVAVLVFCVGAYAQETAPNVAVDLYYETLCPFSRQYFTEQLYPTWLTMSDIMDVRLFPFGIANYNEKADGDGYLFNCQHGPDECIGNMIHTCAQNYFNDINVEMPFVNCLLSADNPATAGPECCDVVNKDWAPIDLCINDIQGEELLHNVALEQEKLDPALEYVPWIVVDGIHNTVEQDICQMDMNLCMCQRYTGTLPDICCNSGNNNKMRPRHPRASRRGH